LGLLSIAAYLKKRIDSSTIKIIDGSFEISDIESFKPDIIGISLLSPFFTFGCQKAKEIKTRFPHLPIILGGHHITYLPANLPKESEAGVLGEGEEIFFQICKLINLKGKLDSRDLAAIKGIVYWDNNTLKQNEKNDNLLTPNQIPLINNYDICTFKNSFPFDFHIIASRGCPYQCRFCSSSPFWKKVQYYNINTVVGQIEYIIDRYRPRNINFYDDLMIANKTYLKNLHDEIIKRKLNLKTTFNCWVAGKHFDCDVALLLKEMNVSLISFGVESGSPTVYEYLKGKWNSPKKNACAIRLAHSKGFKINISVIVGAAPETFSDLKMTYDYLKSLPFDYGTVGLLKPFPGTMLWEDAKKKHFVNDSMDDWASIESDDILNTNTLFLGEKATREEANYYYGKIKRLIKKKQLLSVWKSRSKKIFIPKYWKIFINRLVHR
jgi:radical SAM superfamily enzyme YgiQ (UPF0313 family)